MRMLPRRRCRGPCASGGPFVANENIAALIEELKTSSSKWLKTQAPSLSKFAWQRGYGIFSVGPSDLEAVVKYIDSQEEHHRKVDFREELIAFLKKYGVDYDERYIWD